MPRQLRAVLKEILAQYDADCKQAFSIHLQESAKLRTLLRDRYIQGLLSSEDCDRQADALDRDYKGRANGLKSLFFERIRHTVEDDTLS